MNGNRKRGNDMTQTAVFLLFDASPPSKPQCQMVWPTHLCTYNFSPNERRPHFPARHNGSLVHPIASKSFSSHRVRIAYFCKPSHPRANNDSCRTWNDILTICPAPFGVSSNLVGINFQYSLYIPFFASWKTITYKCWHV